MIGIFKKLKNALGNTSNKISSGIDHVFLKKKLNNETLESLEEILLFADVGVEVSADIIAQLKKHKFDKEVSPNEIKQDLANIMVEILDKQNHNLELKSDSLNVILVSGINGSGKTTTIGKMAKMYASDGKKVAIAACDTFRAAAVDQLKKWSDRSDALFFQGKEKSDPASVAYEAVLECKNKGIDVLFIDTAGRLHNHKNLMDELAKIIRVIKKVDSNAPHHSVLVIDGTTGQNASVQVGEFKSCADISGLIITKLDGTAKAGALVGIVQKFELPVHFIGMGEGIDDLKPFISSEFSKALVGIDIVDSK